MAAGGVGYWGTGYWNLEWWHEDWWAELVDAVPQAALTLQLGEAGPSVIVLDAQPSLVVLDIDTVTVVLDPDPEPVLIVLSSSESAMAVQSFQKQPLEEKTVAFEWSTRIPTLLTGVTIVSGLVYASDKSVSPKPTTTLASGASVGSGTLSLVADPGVGALMTLNGSGPTAELLKATAVSGSGPYTVTIRPVLHFAHNSGETVSYEPGVSAMVLESTTLQVVSTTTVFRGRRGVHGRTFRISKVITLSTGDVREGEADMVVADE